MNKDLYGQDAWNNFSHEGEPSFCSCDMENMEVPRQEGCGPPHLGEDIEPASFGGGNPYHMGREFMCHSAGSPPGWCGNCICCLIKGCFYLPNLRCIIESHICNEGVKYIFRHGRWQAILKYTIWLKYINNQNKTCWAQRKGCLILGDAPCDPCALCNYVVCISQPPCIKRCGNVIKVFAKVLFCRC